MNEIEKGGEKEGRFYKDLYVTNYKLIDKLYT